MASFASRACALEECHVESLRSRGYAVVDGFLGDEWSKALRTACVAANEKGDLSQHYFKFGNELYAKPNIFELDLHDEAKLKKSSELVYLFEEGGPKFVRRARAALPFLNLDDAPPAIKLQFNAGSKACFPAHYDNNGRPSKRKLTCVVYLNPSWTEGHGGEIVLFPFLGDAVVVPPKMDRAVLFVSDLILHRVMPSAAPRYCFTVWIDGVDVNSDADALLTRDKLRFTSFDNAEAFFAASPLQRTISRAVYDDVYEKSLIECVGGTKGEAPMLAQHRAAVSTLMRSLKPLIVEFRRRRKGKKDVV